MSLIATLISTIFYALNVILSFYSWIIIIGVILSWLVTFDVINPRNRFVQVVGDFCHRLTEPALRRIRRFVPPISGLDLSFLVLWLLVKCAIYFVNTLAMRMVM